LQHTELKTLKGEIDKIIMFREDTCYGVLVIKGESELGGAIKTQEKLVGNFPGVQISKGLKIEVEGYYQQHVLYGVQFAVKSARNILPDTSKGLQKYIMDFVPFIGPVYSKKIVEYFGKDLIDILNTGSDNLYDVAGVPIRSLDNLKFEWSQNIKLRDLRIFLSKFGISTYLAEYLYDTLGEDALTQVQENPYALLNMEENIGFKKIDNIALTIGIDIESVKRKKAILLYILTKDILVKGHLYLPLDEQLLKKELRKFFKKFAIHPFVVDNEDICDLLKHMQEEDKTVIISRGADNQLCAYSKLFFTVESAAAMHFSGLIVDAKRHTAGDLFPGWQGVLSSILGTSGHLLQVDQRSAIEHFIESPFSVLSGLPGTGKSFVVSLIARICQFYGLSPIVLAPTGKAAKRVSEMSGLEASTIHRFLGYARSHWKYNEHNQLSVPLVIVDECSMIDIPLFYRLVSGVTDVKRMIFVGDTEQLPPVGPGNVFKDLISLADTEYKAYTHLTEIFRQAQHSGIVQNAHAISKGKPLNFGYADCKFFECSDPDKVVGIIKKTALQLHGAGLSVQVLSPRYGSQVGVESLNDCLRNAFNTNRANINVGTDKFFRVGDRVIITKNDYDLNVFNGEQGVIIDFCDILNEFTIDMQDDRNIKMSVEKAYDRLLCSYCITVHKAQGSEFDVVIFPFMNMFQNQLRRDLFYTALTRAKKYCVICGEVSALQSAVGNRYFEERRHNFLYRIRKSLFLDV